VTHFSNINIIELGAQVLVNRLMDDLNGPERALFAALRTTGWVTTDKDSRIYLLPATDRLDFIRNIEWHENELEHRPVFETAYRNFTFTVDPVASTFTIRDQEGAAAEGAEREHYHIMPDGSLEWDEGTLGASEHWPEEEWAAWEKSVANLYNGQGLSLPDTSPSLEEEE
jgi:hypothetical protein